MKKLTYSQYIEKGVGYIVDSKLQKESVGLHNHDFFEIEFILNAKNSYHILNGKKRSITKGSIYIINPSDIHSYEIESGGLIMYVEPFVMLQRAFQAGYGKRKHSRHGYQFTLPLRAGGQRF